MYHSRWKGSHYEAGLRYGNILRKNGIDLVSGIMKSRERSEFARQCIPAYQKFYPEILEEIRGMAEGLQIESHVISDFLLSMYCFVADVHCSVFAFCADGKTIFGRNSDFLARFDKISDSAYYKLDGANSFVGNTTAWTEIEDGVNEHGLAAGLTIIYPTKIGYGINAGMEVRYILEKCDTTAQAISALYKLPHASQHTITLADSGGDIAVVECSSEKISVIRPCQGKNYVFITNHFISPEMQQYQYEGEDDIYSHERYNTLMSAFQNENQYSFDFAKDLLSGKKGFLCQYDRGGAMDTVWSSIYDLREGTAYRAEGNPSRKMFQKDNRISF